MKAKIEERHNKALKNIAQAACSAENEGTIQIVVARDAEQAQELFEGLRETIRAELGRRSHKAFAWVCARTPPQGRDYAFDDAHAMHVLRSTRERKAHGRGAHARLHDPRTWEDTKSLLFGNADAFALASGPITQQANAEAIVRLSEKTQLTQLLVGTTKLIELVARSEKLREASTIHEV